MICSPNQNKIDLKTICTKLRAAPLSKQQTSRNVNKMSAEAESSWRHIPDSAFDLLSRLLDLNPFTRITAEEGLKHPFFAEMSSES